nr:MAG TPA: Endonuclease [Caudoviricetes sp.]
MSKYNNQKIRVGGELFDSKREYNRWCELRLLERSGIICNLQRQVKFRLIDSQKTPERTERPCDYIADFVYYENGNRVVEDCKGMRTDVYKIKRKLMLEKYNISIKET